MATFQKRRKSWRAMVRRKGKTVTSAFDTKVEAERWAFATEAGILDGVEAEAIARELPPSPEGTPMVVALQRYADEVSPPKQGARWEQVRIKAFIRDDALFQRPITSIPGSDIATWRNKRLRKVSPSTVNSVFYPVSSPSL